MSTFYRTFQKQEFGWINFASLRNIISFRFALRKIHQVCNNPQDQKTLSVLKQEYWPSNHCLNLVTNWRLSEMEREKGIFWKGPKRFIYRREKKMMDKRKDLTMTKGEASPRVNEGTILQFLMFAFFCPLSFLFLVIAPESGKK